MDPFNTSPAKLTKAFSVALQRQPRESYSGLEAAFIDDQEWREQQGKSWDQAKEYLDATWQKELNELEAKRQELHALAREFHSLLPPDLQEDVTTAPNFSSDVSEAVDKVRLRWEKRSETDAFAKARDYLRKVGSTINNHSNTLNMLPSSNNYASIFCGALTVFIKASSNYVKLCEGFAYAMTEINDSITTVHEEVLQYKEEIDIQHLVVRLYCQIFTFFINAMKWYRARRRIRLIRSLNENLYSLYQEQVLEIRRLSDVIHKRALNRKLADLSTAAVLSQDGLKFLTELREHDSRSASMKEDGYFERLSTRLRNEYKDVIRDQQDLVQQSIMDNLMTNLVPEVSRYIAGAAATRHLESTAAGLTTRPVSRSSFHGEQPLSSTDLANAQPLVLGSNNDTAYTRQQVLLHSARLAAFFSDKRILPFFSSNETSTFLADANVVSRIRSLTVSPTSAILHVRGPAEWVEETQTARVAARYATASRAAGASVVSYFCSLGRGSGEPPPGRTRETMALVAVAYAVIRQLVELLPEDEAGERRFGEEFGPARFAALDGTLRSWSETLALLGDLLGANDEPLLYVVIDGLNLLDDASRNSTTEALRKFVALMQRHVGLGTGREKHLVKLLFTTAGESAALNEGLDGGDVVTASTPIARESCTGRGFGRKPL